MFSFSFLQSLAVPSAVHTSPHNHQTHILIFSRCARLSAARRSPDTVPCQVVTPITAPEPGSLDAFTAPSPPNTLCGLLLFTCCHESALLCSRELHAGFVWVSAAPQPLAPLLTWRSSWLIPSPWDLGLSATPGPPSWPSPFLDASFSDGVNGSNVSALSTKSWTLRICLLGVIPSPSESAPPRKCRCPRW